MSNNSCSNCSCSAEDQQAEARREFLKQATTITLGALSLTILSGCETDEVGVGGVAAIGEKGTPVFGFLVDSEKCIGAGK